MRHLNILTIAAFVLALLPAGTALALEEPKDEMDRQLNMLQVQLHNAMVKVKNEISGMGPVRTGPVAMKRDAAMSPAGACCENNMIAIGDASLQLRAMFQDLRYRFREGERRAGVASVRAMGFHLDDLEGRVRQFGGTGERELAIKFLELAMAALTNMKQEKLDLEACCSELLPALAPAAPVPADQ